MHIGGQYFKLLFKKYQTWVKTLLVLMHIGRKIGDIN